MWYRHGGCPASPTQPHTPLPGEDEGPGSPSPRPQSCEAVGSRWQQANRRPHPHTPARRAAGRRPGEVQAQRGAGPGEVPQQAHSQPGAAVSHRERLRRPGPAAPEELQQARRLPEAPRGSPRLPELLHCGEQRSRTRGESCGQERSCRSGKRRPRRQAVLCGALLGQECTAAVPVSSCHSQPDQALLGATCCSQLGGPNVPATPGDLCPKLLPTGAPTGLRLPVPPLPCGDLSVVHKQVWKLNASLMSMGLGWGKASPAHAYGKPFQAPASTGALG